MSIEDSDLDWPTAVPEMKSAVIPVLVVARKYFRQIKRGDCRALLSHGRFIDLQCSHLIARSPCDFCPKRRSIAKGACYGTQSLCVAMYVQETSTNG